jgi:6-phosphogluconolactonase
MRREDLHIFKTPEELADRFSDRLMEQVKQHAGVKFHLAISGGKTPNLLFDALASKYSSSPDWQKVHFWWVDERMVQPTDPESNFGIAEKLLFSKISIPERNIHRIKGENLPEAEALSYSTLIGKNLPGQNGWPGFDLILLGMGDDGHTASIFPNQMKLLSSEQICESATHPTSGQKRVTLTGKAIANSSLIAFLVTGEGKAYRVNEIFLNKPEAHNLPAYHIKNAQWFVDYAAAKLIS